MEQALYDLQSIMKYKICWNCGPLCVIHCVQNVQHHFTKERFRSMLSC